MSYRLIFRFLLFFSIMVAISILPTTAWADEPKQYIESTDLAMELLKALFAGAINFGSGKDGLQGIVLIINFFAMTLSCLYAAGTIISQLLKGATTGQVLQGETKTSIPLRFIFAVFMPAPIFNGYAGIQVILLMVISGIFNLNSMTWSLFTDKTNFIQTLATSPVQPESKRLARNVLMMSMCMRAYEFQAKRGGRTMRMGWSVGFGDSKKTWYGADTGATLAPANAGTKLVEGENSLVELLRSEKTRTVQLMAGDPENSSEVKHNACGYINVKSFYEAKQNTWGEVGKVAVDAGTGIFLAKQVGDANPGSTASWAAWTAAITNGFDAIITGVYNVAERKQWAEQAAYGHAKALEDLMLEADKISYEIYAKVENAEAKYNQQVAAAIAGQNGVTAEQYGLNTQMMTESMSKDQIVTAIDGLASRYQSTLREQAGLSKNGGEQYEKLVQDAQKYGWLPAGMIFTQAASITDGMNEISMTMPDTEVVLTSQETFLNKDFNSRYLSKINEYFQNSNVYKDDNYVVAITDKDIKDSQEGAERQNRSGGMFGGIGDLLVNQSLNFFVEPNSHPIAQMHRWGRTLIIGSTALTVQNGLNLNSQSDDIGYSIVFRTVLWTVAGTMMVLGITMAFLIPMLPTFYWIGTLIRIFSNIIQMVLISPLFAAFHALPHQSSDFAGSQRMGWQKMFVGCVESFFALCGFIGSFVMMSIFGVALNMMFMFIYKASTLDGSGFLMSIVTVFVMPIIYGVMTFLLIKNSMSLMHSITDGMTSFIGGGGNIGQSAEQFGGGFSNSFGSVAQKSASPISAIRNDLAEIERLKQGNKHNGVVPTIVAPDMPNGGASGGGIDPDALLGGDDGNAPITQPPTGGAGVNLGSDNINAITTGGINGDTPVTNTAPVKHEADTYSSPTLSGNIGSTPITVQGGMASMPVGGKWAAVENYRGIATDYAGVDMATSEAMMQPGNLSPEQREEAAQKVAGWAKAQGYTNNTESRPIVDAMYNGVVTEMQTGSKEYGDAAYALTQDMHSRYSDRPEVYEARMRQLNQRLNPDTSNKYASYYGAENMMQGTSHYIAQGLEPIKAWNQASEDIASKIEADKSARG